MFRLSETPIDPAPLLRSLDEARAGACVTFAGWVRNHNDGRAVQRLDYEAYPVLAVKEGERVVAEARAKFPVLGIVAVHRTGSLAIGDMAVWVGVTAEHRDAAYAASRYVIDELKARVPIWKKEHYPGAEPVWINCATRGEHAQAAPPR
jgi:molybdopterin synthase catalytic subunit